MTRLEKIGQRVGEGFIGGAMAGTLAMSTSSELTYGEGAYLLPLLAAGTGLLGGFCLGLMEALIDTCLCSNQEREYEEVYCRLS